MINYLQNTAPSGSQNFLQQQATANRVPEEIRTHSAEQVTLRSVEQAAAAPKVKEAEAEGAKTGQPEKEEPKPTIPPPPSRFQLKVQENTQRVNETRQAVTQFFLSAATITGAPEEGQRGARGAEATPSVDVMV